MNLLPFATTTDLSEFLTLPDAVQAEVTAWHGLLASVSPPIQRSLSAIASRMGCSLQTARRKYDAHKKSGWRGLVNRSKAPELARAGLSPDFIAWWKTLCLQNARKCRPAYREFVRRFKSGAPIPGLEPGVPRDTLPPGCTYSNLIRHKPTPFELAASRIGRGAASDYRPKVLTTRAGLEVGQRYLFDDLWHDFKVVMVGGANGSWQRRPMRLLQLHAHDLFSACQFARGLKPRVEDPETGQSVNLNQDEMLFLLAHVFTEFGFHPDGCALMLEHGTAAVNETVERAIYDISGGKVTVLRSGIQGDAAFAGQYPGRGKGNFRFKAALESLGNLIHNETAALLQFPGQTGSNSRLNCPEELHGREKISDQLALAILALPPSVAVQLRLPFLEVTTAKWLVEEVMERINRRTDHELEGWLESGLSTVDLHIPVGTTSTSSPSRTLNSQFSTLNSAEYLSLSPEQRAAIDAIATPAPRRLSPREVFDAGRPRLVRFRPEQTAALLKDRQGREVSVGADHLVTYEDQSISPAPLTYLAHHFAPGDKFHAVVNPWAPDKLALFDARGRWLGFLQAWQKAPHADPEALHRQMGAAAKVQSELLRPLAAAGADLTRKRLEDTRHNSRVLKGEAAAREAAADETTDILLKASTMF